MSSADALATIRGRLVVSCQAPDGDPFRDPESIARFAAAAVQGGAAGIRACGTGDVRAIRGAVQVPIIGIEKTVQADGRILITPSFDGARALVQAGADMIAIDCTERGRRHGALERLRRINDELGIPVLADIATEEEAVTAAHSGAAAVLTTLRGYTDDTAQVTCFEPAFVASLCRSVSIPVIAEGRIDTPDQARRAVDAGAWCVIVGTAITRPVELARRFAQAVEGAEPAPVAAIDLGGTNTKSGLVQSSGRLCCERTTATPSGGRDVLLQHLRAVARQCLSDAKEAGVVPAALGIATAGWVDPRAGRVVYATENLPGWTGTEVASILGDWLGMRVAVENDANALALAEQQFGAGRGVDHFVCLTLGTGVGGGCCIDGRLNRGAHFFANALGHVAVEPDGLPCTCGGRGCLEQYANAAALMRYAGADAFSTPEDVIGSANHGNAPARAAIRQLAVYLARGCAAIVHVLDPELIVLSGGLVQNNSLLLSMLREEMASQTMMWQRRNLRLEISTLGYYGGLFGAAAIARRI
jgi:putative N-acetylmannosamine-6-phosphate epimerase/predicted NBD/HSP70 family sugar kinase